MSAIYKKTQSPSANLIPIYVVATGYTLIGASVFASILSLMFWRGDFDIAYFLCFLAFGIVIIVTALRLMPVVQQIITESGKEVHVETLFVFLFTFFYYYYIFANIEQKSQV